MKSFSYTNLFVDLFEFLQKSIMRRACKDFNCLKLQMCESKNIDISIFYLFVYSNLITTIQISNIWLTHLQFCTIKIMRNYAQLNCSKPRLISIWIRVMVSRIMCLKTCVLYWARPIFEGKPHFIRWKCQIWNNILKKNRVNTIKKTKTLKNYTFCVPLMKFCCFEW